MTNYREKKSALTKDEMWEDDGILVPTQLNSSVTWKSKKKRNTKWKNQDTKLELRHLNSSSKYKIKKHKIHIEREKHKVGTKVGSLIHQNAFQWTMFMFGLRTAVLNAPTKNFLVVLNNFSE